VDFHRWAAAFYANSVSTFLLVAIMMMFLDAALETTLSTLDSCMNMDEEPALKRPKYVAAAAKKINIVTFK